ncbi:MAG: hypothetical protein GY850_15640 [bacterium]|nr:hypothetical protein [bacterium]
MRKAFYPRIVLKCLIFILICPAIAAATRGESYYHHSGDRLFWFMIISDIHIGADGVQDTDYLTWAVTEARNIIDPRFMVATGDLTDSTNGGVIPDGPYTEEWTAYRGILDSAGMSADFYYDLPGNHDHYNDKKFAYYLNYSIQGSAHGTTQHSWTREFSYGKYHFLGIATTGNDGAEFSIWPWDFFGDHAEMTSDEIAFLNSALTSHPDAEITFMFGHHPFEADSSDWTETAINDGLDDLLNLIDLYGVSLYGYGHTHDYVEDIWSKYIVNNIFYMNVDSLGKSNNDHYALMAVDGNGVSIIPAQKGLWPVVMITAPANRCLGECPNSYAYEIPQSRFNPIRALIFDKNPVSGADFRIDGTGDWHAMQQIENTPVWFGLWDARLFAPGSHTVAVRAQGSSVVIDRVKTYINPDIYQNDSDDDGILDVAEDANHNGTVDSGETDPKNPDTDGDGVQDGTELGQTSEDIEPGTNTAFFQPDLDPSTKTDPLDPDTDGDHFKDGIEDANQNGRVDLGETDPIVWDLRTMPWVLLLLLYN